MIQLSPKLKLEYGDFQTPLELAEKICAKLLKLEINPDIIVEPTCGIGNFIQAALHSFQTVNQILGFEINSNYLQKLQDNQHFSQDQRVQVHQGDFFDLDWSSIINKLHGEILVLGNFPWITNSQQGTIDGKNLPQKTNFQHHNGLDAITGKSNFDISEWMLIQVIHWLQNHDAYLAMLCKTSVARKILNYCRSNDLNLACCATYGINTKRYFDATVDACLLVCRFDSNSKHYFCDVFSDLDTETSYRIAYRNNTPIRDVSTFDKLIELHNLKTRVKWRSGVKHDCSNVMELYKLNDRLINGLGEVVEIEETCLFPLIKGSAVAQNRIHSVDRYVLVTQKYVGEPTEYLQSCAPKTWQYLTEHSNYLDGRKSKIYKQSSRFSIFGVGPYTFAPWKIAICGLYKKLDFRFVGETGGKPTVFDDTVYFLSFEDEKIAHQVFALLISPTAIDFYSSLIFWDEKRPIKSSVLNSLDLITLAGKLSVNPQNWDADKYF